MLSYGAKIKELRRGLGLTSTELAEQIGVSIQYVSNVERSPHWDRYRRYGKLHMVRAFAEALKVDWLELLPHWLLSRGRVVLEVTTDLARYGRGGPDGMKLYFLSYLLRNWGRLTETDLHELNALLTKIHAKWENT